MKELAKTGTLKQLAKRINEAHRQAMSGMREAVQHAVAAGEDLIQVKAELDHGEFLPWIEVNCEFRRITAHIYMRIAVFVPTLPSNVKRTKHLPLYDLAKLSRVKEPDLHEVIDLYEDAEDGTYKTIDEVIKVVRAKKKDAERKKRAKAARKATVGDDQDIVDGDFREFGDEIADDSVDLIFTDPPYDRASIPLYADLGELAVRVLKPGGSLITYVGSSVSMEAMDALRVEGLSFLWHLACVHTGKTSTRMWEYGIVVKWKLMLWFVKGTNRRDTHTFVDDLIMSEPNKTDHDWQQGTIEAKYYIEKLTEPGELVLDPFCGGGTTAVAAKELGRRWLSCDTDADSVNISRLRVKDTHV